MKHKARVSAPAVAAKEVGGGDRNSEGQSHGASAGEVVTIVEGACGLGDGTVPTRPTEVHKVSHGRESDLAGTALEAKGHVRVIPAGTHQRLWAWGLCCCRYWCRARGSSAQRGGKASGLRPDGVRWGGAATERRVSLEQHIWCRVGEVRTCSALDACKPLLTDGETGPRGAREHDDVGQEDKVSRFGESLAVGG